MTYYTVAGVTSDQDFQLLEDGAPLDTTIQGLTVVLILRDKYGVRVDSVGDVTNLDDATPENRGKVRVNLDATDLSATLSPYYARWRVTDENNKVIIWPTADADIWIVGRGEA